MREQENIKDELQKLSPFLAKLKKPNDGFDVPEHYFQNFENNLMARIKAEEEVNSWSTSTETTTDANTNTSASWTTRLIDWLKTPQVSISFAMVLVIGLAISIILQPTDDHSENGIAQISIEEAISDVSTEEMLAYVEENVEDFDETLLSVVVEEDEEVTEMIETPTLETIETEELEEYLDENIEEFAEELIEEEILEYEEYDE